MTNNNSDQRPATLNDVVAALNKNGDLLEEVATWLRVSGYDKVKNLLDSALDTPEKKQIYQLSDGRTTREIGGQCNVAHNTVAVYWRTWHKTGLMKSIRVSGGGDRYIRNFELKDFGIEVPRLAPKQQASLQEQLATAVQNQTESDKI